MRSGGRRKWLPEKGDLIVLLSVLLLAWMFLGPLQRGHRLGRREERALIHLAELRKEAEARGLPRLLEALSLGASGIEGLQPFREYGAGASPGIHPLWQGGGYFFGFGEGDCLLARPRKPPETGRILFRLGPGGEWSEEVLASGKTGSDLRRKAGEAARSQLLKLGKLCTELGFHEELRRWRESPPPGLRVLPARSSGEELARGWTDGRYLLRFAISQGREGLELEFYAWPVERSRSGFSAFHLKKEGPAVQTANMAHSYEGRSGFPRPEAAKVRRSLRGDGSFVGLDGNRWYPVPGS